jgi:hypothetical protein
VRHTGDTLTISGPAAAGTADSIGIDTDGDLVINDYIYATGGPIGTISEATGMIITVANDTVRFSTTLGTAITTDEITDSTITGADISSSSNLKVARINTSDSIVINGGTSVKKFRHRYVDPSGNQNHWTFTPCIDSKYRISSDSVDNILVFDARNDRVGILNLTPSYTLDVTGNGQFTTDLIIGDDLFADSGYFRVVTAGGQNIDNDSSIASEGEVADIIDTITTDTIPVADKAVLSDSTKAIDTTNTTFTTYFANHGGAGTVTDAILGDTLNRYFDTAKVNDFIDTTSTHIPISDSAVVTGDAHKADSLYGDANSYAFYRNDTLFKYVGGQFSYEYYDGTTIVYEVTGAGLSYVDSAGKITDNAVTGADLYSTNSASDNYIPSFDDATGGFTWVSAAYVDSAGNVTDDALDVNDFGDGDWGDVSVSSNSVTLDAGVVAAAEMADADHGDVAWSSGVATVQDVDTTGTKIATALGNRATNAELGKISDDTTTWNTVATRFDSSYSTLTGVHLTSDLAWIDTFVVNDTFRLWDSTNQLKIYYKTDSGWVINGGAAGNSYIDSAGNVTDGTIDFADIASNSIDSTKIVAASISHTDLRADLLGNFIDTTSVDTIQNAHKAVLSDSTLNIHDGAVDAADLAADIVDSTKVGADNLSLTDINWTYEWIYLTDVHGFDRALEDSIYLYDNIQYGDTLILLIDSAGNITAGDDDTVSIAGYLPYACTIDSLEVMYMTSAEIVDVYFNGPTLTTPSNLCDSNYWTSATDLTSAGWDTACYTFANDVSAVAGDRYSFKYIVNYGADNERLRIAWIRMRVKR